MSSTDEPESRRQRPTGTWAGYLVFALCLLVLVVLAVQAAYIDAWARFTGIAVFSLAFVLVPTGGVKKLRRSLRGCKPLT